MTESPGAYPSADTLREESMDRSSQSTFQTYDPVSFRGGVCVRLPDRVIAHVRAELVGGRNRYSVGGQIAEGPRWWRGRLEWTGDEAEPMDSTAVIIDLTNGRSGTAVIEPDPAAPAHTAVVRGVGPPPFDIP